MADGLRWDATPRACREYAINQLLASPDQGRREQILGKLKDEPREEVGRFAVFCVQSDTLRLKPWVSAPCWGERATRGDCPGDAEAAALVTKMRALKISLFHPDPLGAIAAAEAAAIR